MQKRSLGVLDTYGGHWEEFCSWMVMIQSEREKSHACGSSDPRTLRRGSRTFELEVLFFDLLLQLNSTLLKLRQLHFTVVAQVGDNLQVIFHVVLILQQLRNRVIPQGNLACRIVECKLCLCNIVLHTCQLFHKSLRLTLQIRQNVRIICALANVIPIHFGDRVTLGEGGHDLTIGSLKSVGGQLINSNRVVFGKRDLLARLERGINGTTV